LKGNDKVGKNKEKGVATLEMVLILPVLCILLFGIVDFGRLIQARLVVTNVSREGGSLASRDLKVGNDLLVALQGSSSPLDLQAMGRIYVSKINAGETAAAPDPMINSQISSGSLNVNSGIDTKLPHLGLSEVLYNHLKFNSRNQTSDISEITVVEVFYKYRPITPLPNFIQNILLNDGDGIIIGSKAVF
jgi:Flp pilus assembly protein TadG